MSTEPSPLENDTPLWELPDLHHHGIATRSTHQKVKTLQEVFTTAVLSTEYVSRSHLSSKPLQATEQAFAKMVNSDEWQIFPNSGCNNKAMWLVSLEGKNVIVKYGNESIHNEFLNAFVLTNEDGLFAESIVFFVLQFQDKNCTAYMHVMKYMDNFITAETVLSDSHLCDFHEDRKIVFVQKFFEWIAKWHQRIACLIQEQKIGTIFWNDGHENNIVFNPTSCEVLAVDWDQFLICKTSSDILGHPRTVDTEQKKWTTTVLKQLFEVWMNLITENCNVKKLDQKTQAIITAVQSRNIHTFEKALESLRADPP